MPQLLDGRAWRAALAALFALPFTGAAISPAVSNEVQIGGMPLAPSQLTTGDLSRPFDSNAPLLPGGEPVTSGELELGPGPHVSPTSPLVVFMPMTQDDPEGRAICVNSQRYLASERDRQACGTLPATAISKVSSGGTCPAGSFHDPIMGGSCWSCPSDFIRSTLPVYGEQACWKAISENLAQAKHVAKFGCDAGSFLDPRNGGECWSCPSGFNRTWEAVTHARACSKSWAGPFATATFHKRASWCPAGSFFDPIDGGTCWSCPEGFRRTLHHVKDDRACAQTVDTQYSRATMEDNLGCRTAEGEPVLWRPGLPFPYVFGSTCYSCPTFDESSGEMIVGSPTTFDFFGAEVRTGTQCYTIMRWKPSLPEVVYLLNTDGLGQAAEPNDGTSPRKHYNAPEAPGARALLAELMRDPQVVTDYLRNRMPEANDTALAAAWEEIAANPAESEHVQALLLARLLQEVQKPSQERTAAGAAIIGSLERFIQSRQLTAAEDALAMYGAWQRGIDSMRQNTRRSSLQHVFDYIDVPPRFDIVALQKLALDEAGFKSFVAAGRVGQFLATRAATVGMTRSLGFLARGNATWVLEILEDTGNTGFRTYRAVANVLNGTKIARAGGQVASGLVKSVATGSAAALAVSVFAGIVLDKAIADVIQAATMEEKLQAGVDSAKKPVDLVRMAEEAPLDVAYWWSQMTAYGSHPTTDIGELARAAAEIAAANEYFPPLTWHQMSGAATDIGIGADGTVWVVGDGGSIYRSTERDQPWEPMPGQGVRIGVGSGNDAWVVNAPGDIWHWDGGQWVPVCTAATVGDGRCQGLHPALDIGVAGDGTVVAINRKGQLFRKVVDRTRPASAVAGSPPCVTAAGESCPTGVTPSRWGEQDIFQPVAQNAVVALRVDALRGGRAAVLGADRQFVHLYDGGWQPLGVLPIGMRRFGIVNVPDPSSTIISDIAASGEATVWAATLNGRLMVREPGASGWSEAAIEGAAPSSAEAVAVGGSPGVVAKDRSIFTAVAAN